MGKRRITTLATPFPATDSQKVFAMHAIHRQGDRWHKRSGIMPTTDETAALEGRLQEGGLIVASVEK